MDVVCRKQLVLFFSLKGNMILSLLVSNAPLMCDPKFHSISMFSSEEPAAHICWSEELLKFPAKN
jgi:hypothetical protein